MRCASSASKLVEAGLEIERLEQRLLLLGSDVHQARDEVGQARGPLDRLQCPDHFLRHLRQELQDLDGTFLQRPRPTLQLRIGDVRIVDELDASHGERITVEELQHPEAPQAACDRMVQPVRRRDVAQHGGARADPVQVLGARHLDIGLALQQHAERTLESNGLLRRRAGTLATDGQRKDRSRKHHDIAYRQDDQRILGNRARCVFRPRGRRTRRCVLGRAALDRQRRGIRVRFVVHG